MVGIIGDTTHGYDGQGKTWTDLQVEQSGTEHVQSTHCIFVTVLDALKDTVLWQHLG